MSTLDHVKDPHYPQLLQPPSPCLTFERREYFATSSGTSSPTRFLQSSPTLERGAFPVSHSRDASLDTGSGSGAHVHVRPAANQLEKVSSVEWIKAPTILTFPTAAVLVQQNHNQVNTGSDVFNEDGLQASLNSRHFSSDAEDVASHASATDIPPPLEPPRSTPRICSRLLSLQIRSLAHLLLLITSLSVYWIWIVTLQNDLEQMTVLSTRLRFQFLGNVARLHAIGVCCLVGMYAIGSLLAFSQRDGNNSVIFYDWCLRLVSLQDRMNKTRLAQATKRQRLAFLFIHDAPQLAMSVASLFQVDDFNTLPLNLLALVLLTWGLASLSVLIKMRFLVRWWLKRASRLARESALYVKQKEIFSVRVAIAWMGSILAVLVAVILILAPLAWLVYQTKENLYKIFT